jgi:Zn-dependent M28 family amino/carboxypeptidase
MSKIIIYIIVLMIVLIVAGVFYYIRHMNFVPLPPPEPVKPTIEMAVNLVTLNQLKENVLKLVEFNGRDSGTAENDAAAKWIGDQFISMGYQVEYQKFNVGGRQTSNVIASLPGKNENEVVVIGAHYDGQGRGKPGADDNASGASMVLMVSKACAIFNKKELNHTIVFQLYSGEEYGLIGSNYYCHHPLFPKNNPDISKHLFMLNLDMIGYMKTATPFQLAMPKDPTPDVRKLIERLSNKYYFAKSITFRGSAGSDHASFLNAGVPVAFLHTGMHSNYHKPSDTPDKLNYMGMESIAKYTVELLLEVAQSSQRLEFNRKNFQSVPLENMKDHDAVPFFSP